MQLYVNTSFRIVLLRDSLHYWFAKRWTNGSNIKPRRLCPLYDRAVLTAPPWDCGLATLAGEVMEMGDVPFRVPRSAEFHARVCTTYSLGFFLTPKTA